MPRRLRLVLPPLLLIASAAGQGPPDANRAEIERFRQAREASLKAEDGWPSVAGLHWLKPGEARVGGETASDVLLPEGAPDRVGTLTLEGDQARFRAAPGAHHLPDRPAPEPPPPGRHRRRAVVPAHREGSGRRRGSASARMKPKGGELTPGPPCSRGRRDGRKSDSA